jgi:hypothetical protein
MNTNSIFDDMIEIKQNYRSLFDAALYYHMCDIKNIKSIEDLYGVDSLFFIIQINEYNKTIDILRAGLTINNQYTEMAERYIEYFKTYSQESYKIQNKIGKESTMIILDTLYRYFKLFGMLFHYEIC